MKINGPAQRCLRRKINHKKLFRALAIQSEDDRSFFGMLGWEIVTGNPFSVVLVVQNGLALNGQNFLAVYFAVYRSPY